MAILPVNPTRMVLAQLKKRLSTSMRGHKLLKEKRDDLMKRFLALAQENKVLRTQVEAQMEAVYAGFTAASVWMGEAALQQALMLSRKQIRAGMRERNFMGVKAPEFQFAEVGKAKAYPYGFAFTAGELDDAMDTLDQVLPLLLQLAQTEKTVQLLAGEIERTRRRVNALEYVQIPTLQETIRSITMKLDENERGNLARLMKVKDLMIAKQRQKT